MSLPPEPNVCMRCAVRICLLGTCSLIAIIYFAVQASNSRITETWDENDALARHILEGSDAAAEHKAGAPPTNTSLSASVAIVIVISLVSVSLLITGIIIVAITIDPTTADEESDIEWDSPRHPPETAELLSNEEHDDSKCYYSGQLFHEL
ncbi:hypothetical protein Y032_0176g565 [Ancylostoma ceylanicum]|uniref:Uncharacterized protein n=1 Tax=Ancylostoma ceylanicum TaxID=53326 RepID=A0A016SUU1_9BILA|nr:hypothetical protein Y032_0176g565 [Ancylostoma ceylanicum]